MAEVMAWNVLDAFSDENRAQGILEVVEEQQPDVAVFLEAWREDKAHPLEYALEELEAKGYATLHGLYDDNDGRQDRHGILGIVRRDNLADRQPQLVSLGSRNAVHIPFVDESTEQVIDFFGTHLDDRTEERRMGQANRLIAAAEFSGRVVIGGDFNALYRDDSRAKMLRIIKPLAQRMPTVEPRPDFKPPKLKRIGSLASRLTDMATGTTMEQFVGADFEDTDPKRQPTKGPFMLDHIVVRGVTVNSQQTLEKSPLSDHRAVSASVRV